ncbi:hypothetical protein [Cellulomonas soli]
MTDTATSAAQTALTTVQLLRDDRLARTAADTALLDATRQLDDADLRLTTYLAPDEDTDDLRDEVAAAVGEVSDAIVRARAWANRTADASSAADDLGTGAQVEADLDSAAQAVDEVAQTLRAGPEPEVGP